MDVNDNSVLIHFIFEKENWKEISDTYLLTENNIYINFSDLKNELEEKINNYISEFNEILSEEYNVSLSIGKIEIRKKCLDIAIELIFNLLALSANTVSQNLSKEEKEDAMKRNIVIFIGIIAITCLLGFKFFIQYDDNQQKNNLEYQKFIFEMNTIKDQNDKNKKIEEIKEMVTIQYPRKNNKNILEKLDELKNSSSSINTIIADIKNKPTHHALEEPSNDEDEYQGMRGPC